MSNLRSALAVSALVGVAMGSFIEPPTYDHRWPANRIKVGRPWTKAKARNRARNRIARQSRKANRK
jgi:hypothetical protein